ncbi:hypothetical protein, partial [Nesterenkonia lutea]|uniref:hypothetical protein n=1 Tax=Nesterenkonia lutea TaxID=272919 RepID=UPI0031DAD4C3
RGSQLYVLVISEVNSMLTPAHAQFIDCSEPSWTAHDAASGEAGISITTMPRRRKLYDFQTLLRGCAVRFKLFRCAP